MTQVLTPQQGVGKKSGLNIDNIEVRYGEKTAIKDISFSVLPGKTTAVIGPSGCGKSTTLKAVAGLNQVYAGKITLGERDITQASPATRNIGLVPQSYAVFPHMSVRNNIAYGLRARNVPKSQIDGRVDEMLDLTQLGEFADRRPDALSGGQRQRVALARALAISPEVLLLDEPLAALDPQLRGELRRQLAQIIAEADCGTLIVTHDQHEALALADHIAILEKGRLVQLGTPQDLWERPINAFVADFLTNSVLLDATVSGEEVSVLSGQWTLPMSLLSRQSDPRSPQVLIRPTSLRLVSSEAEGAAPATVSAVEYAGGRVLAMGDVFGQKIQVNTQVGIDVGDSVHVAPIPDEVALIGGEA